MNVVDLFSGCGGFSLGFKQSGFNIIKAVEFDKTIAKSYMANHPQTLMINEDISKVDNYDYFQKNEADVIIGGPPCQGFSMAGARIRKGFIDDERNYLFRHYINIVNIINPKVFIMENVKGILSSNKGEIIKEIERKINSAQNYKIYHIYPLLVNAKDFGVPQNRERVIIVGVLDNEIDINKEIKNTKADILKKIPSFFDNVMIKDALFGMPNCISDNLISYPKTAYQEYLHGNSKGVLKNHTQTNHSKKALERIKQIKPNENYTSLQEDINSIHSGSYGRMSFDGISNTITTRFDTPSGGRFIHPIYDRTITPREAARIQSFPDDFVFSGSRTSIMKQIGNAVPIKVAYFFANLTKRILNEYNT
ncbi:TPA: DNA cytosine methyltransferase [Campylobacter jejuni]|nr:DNA cytosine methyltransferase [Campylobacter jejuni]